MRKAGIFAVLLVLLAGINFSIWRTEQALANGQKVILELAPVDPRSLMQGDYMALNFAMGEHIRGLLGTDKPVTGHAVIKLNAQGVARLVRLDDGQPLQDGERLLQFRYREHRVQFATNAFFFQEGTGERYEAARYGLFRVSDDGKPLLTHLLDAEQTIIGQTAVLSEQTTH
ncbi:MAG: GDYXXLXY domain-containing protein, partial [Thiopseudomonas sp.]